MLKGVTPVLGVDTWRSHVSTPKIWCKTPYSTIIDLHAHTRAHVSACRHMSARACACREVHVHTPMSMCMHAQWVPFHRHHKLQTSRLLHSIFVRAERSSDSKKMVVQRVWGIEAWCRMKCYSPWVRVQDHDHMNKRVERSSYPQFMGSGPRTLTQAWKTPIPRSTLSEAQSVDLRNVGSFHENIIMHIKQCSCRTVERSSNSRQECCLMHMMIFYKWLEYHPPIKGFLGWKPRNPLIGGWYSSHDAGRTPNPSMILSGAQSIMLRVWGFSCY